MKLENLKSKLKENENIVLGYFGGSITEGAGASDAEAYSWRALTTKWFKDTFQNAKFEQINAAIGGTNSQFAAYRCYNDLLKFKPDIVFVEFAVNDYMNNAKIIQYSVESITRQILTFDKTCEIVFILTQTKEMYEAKKRNAKIESIEIHKQIARFYSIPYIDVGLECFEHSIDADKYSWDELTTDNVHPNDAGHKMYGDKIIYELRNMLNDENPFYSNKILQDVIMYDAWEIQDCSFQKVDSSLCGKYPHFIESDKDGDSLTVKFIGNSIGIFYMIAKDSGDLAWSVDGGKEQVFSTWDKYALTFNRVNGVILADDLDFGEHTFCIRVIHEKNKESEGYFVRLGAILYGKIEDL